MVSLKEVLALLRWDISCWRAELSARADLSRSSWDFSFSSWWTLEINVDKIATILSAVKGSLMVFRSTMAGRKEFRSRSMVSLEGGLWGLSDSLSMALLAGVLISEFMDPVVVLLAA